MEYWDVSEPRHSITLLLTGKENSEADPLIFDAFHFDFSLMSVDDVFDDRHAQTGAGGFAVRLKGFENSVNEFRRHSTAAIDELDADLSLMSGGANSQAAAFRYIFS